MSGAQTLFEPFAAAFRSGKVAIHCTALVALGGVFLDRARHAAVVEHRKHLASRCCHGGGTAQGWRSWSLNGWQSFSTSPH